MGGWWTRVPESTRAGGFVCRLLVCYGAVHLVGRGLCLVPCTRSVGQALHLVSRSGLFPSGQAAVWWPGA